jgi:hypothetical protein
MDDYAGSAPSPGSAQGVADLRGGVAYKSASGTTVPVGSVFYIGGTTATVSSNNSWVEVGTLDSNYGNTRIISIEAHIIACRVTGGGGHDPVLRFSYTTDGASYTTILTRALSATTLADFSGNLPASLTWDDLMDTNFRLRATRTSGNKNMRVDAMFLRVTYSVDMPTERWHTGSYTSLPISLGAGTIESITITDEQGKIHLNYASQALLQSLLSNLGVSGASTKAANIINYRQAGLTNPFDSVEELRQVAGITAADYAAIKDYVTVYSFVNSDVYRPAGPRAPVNINTAPIEVLKAILDPLPLGAGKSATMATNISNARIERPFLGFYTSTSATNNRYYYNYARNASYLSQTGSPSEKDMVMDNSDPSLLIPFSGSTAFNAATTEFCYAGNVFLIETVVSLSGRKLRLKTLRGNDGSRVFSTYIGDTALSGWRKENFE